MVKVYPLTLGCPKNQADTAALMRMLAPLGAAAVPLAGEADVIMVNTCGFIDEAKRESIDEILSLASSRKEGQKIVVMGCLASRYGKGMSQELPEVDAFFGLYEDPAILEYFRSLAKGATAAAPVSNITSHVLPLKVSEGCARRCSYCVIPSIRGPLRSRRPEEVLAEASDMLRAGARELMVVAQDLTSYGADLKDAGYDLPRLLRELCLLEGDFWVRPLYFYPALVSDELLEAMASESKICKYVDVPLQHSEDRILRSMRRRGTRKEYLKLMRTIRALVPGVVLRTSMIVGFPGETEADFRGLMDFIEEVRFERLGAFLYSREEGTPAYDMKPQVPLKVKERRLQELMQAQMDISLEANRALVGRGLRVLVDEAPDATGRAVGRYYGQAHEIDGVTYIDGTPSGIKAGDFLDVAIESALEYDLQGRYLRGSISGING